METSRCGPVQIAHALRQAASAVPSAKAPGWASVSSPSSVGRGGAMGTGVAEVQALAAACAYKRREMQTVGMIEGLG